jgi:hypothetical protein
MELMSDEATEKRTAEVERPMDKNNTFPQVGLVLLSTHFISAGMYISTFNEVVPHMACKV